MKFERINKLDIDFIEVFKVSLSRLDNENTPEENKGSLQNDSLNRSVIKEVSDHFNQLSLSEEKKLTLEAILLGQRRNSTISSGDFNSLKFFFKANKNLFISNLMTATVVAAISFIIVFAYNKMTVPFSLDVISEVANLSENLNFPADFDLEGNLNNLPSLISDSLPNFQSFTPSIPEQIAKNYSAYEGRFFLFNGEQGVGIHVRPTNQNLQMPLRLNGRFEHNILSTLYIVKLSGRNKTSFSTHKTSRKIVSASGKMKKVYAWSDGSYGYAMVQAAAFSDVGNN